ncbi:MAG: glycosyltransferase [Erysipelotrichia bacterium]|nr:glycosyltransferase [Erysipelotrichia bacterium]
MTNYSEQLMPLFAAALGSLIFWLTGARLTGSTKFSLGRGRYAGAFPFIGAIIGICFTDAISRTPGLFMLALGAGLIAIAGFLRDRFRIAYMTLLPYCIVITAAALYSALPAPVSGLRILAGTTWVLLIIFCLKVSALVYEMPFILLTTTTLTQLVYFAQNTHNRTAVVLNTSLLVASVMLLLYSAREKRVLIGSSGIFAAGFLLAAVSQIEGSGRLLLFGLFVPSMVILFPFALISGMIVASYFGNRLHRPGAGSERNWSWSLQREKTVVFSGLIFLCLNFFGLLVLIEAPAFGYFALFLLLLSSLAGFASTFARKVTTNAPLPLKIEIMGISIDAVMPGQVIDRITSYLGQHEPGLMHIITADSLALVKVAEDERFCTVMQRAEMVVPDGAGIVWASDFLGTPLPGRVPGVALVSQICEKACKAGWKIFFIGGKPGIAKQAADTLRQDFNIEICGIEHGYFAPDSAEEEATLKKIAEARPDIIFVALGVPRQEWFISKLRNCIDHGIAIGVGGSFDVISQTLPRAPVWMQQCGIEWLFRLWLEPSRFMRMLKIPVFVLQILRHKWNTN